MDDIVRPFNEELGLDFDTDVSPWLARSIGIGMWNVDALTENLASLLGTETTGPRPESERFTMVAAIANRDSKAAAAAALEKLASQSDAVPDDPIAGNAVWRFASQEPGDESLASCLGGHIRASQYLMVSGNLGLMSNTSSQDSKPRSTVQTGEATIAGQDEEAYAETLIRLLPHGPGTIFAYGSAESDRRPTPRRRPQAFGDRSSAAQAASSADTDRVVSGGFAVLVRYQRRRFSHRRSPNISRPSVTRTR